MKRYVVKYFNEKSQYSYSTYCIGIDDLHETLTELISEGNFIDMIGQKDEKDTIGYYEEIDKRDLLKELNLLDKNDENEDKAYEAWGL